MSNYDINFDVKARGGNEVLNSLKNLEQIANKLNNKKFTIKLSLGQFNAIMNQLQGINSKLTAISNNKKIKVDSTDVKTADNEFKKLTGSANKVNASPIRPKVETSSISTAQQMIDNLGSRIKTLDNAMTNIGRGTIGNINIS